jgi:hypothetical protein
MPKRKKCDGAPWCMLMVPEGTFSCEYHAKCPPTPWEKQHPEAWWRRFRAEDKARKNAEAKQAESDRKMAARR